LEKKKIGNRSIDTVLTHVGEIIRFFCRMSIKIYPRDPGVVIHEVISRNNLWGYSKSIPKISIPKILRTTKEYG